MKLMRLDEYLETFYTEASRPHRRTLIKRINQHILPGKKEGKFYYVDVEAKNSNIQLTGNLLVDRVLRR